MKKTLLILILLALTACVRTDSASIEPRPMPILMFHMITDNITDPYMQVTPAQFRDFLIAMQDAGFTAISFDDLKNYVTGTGTLPPHPFIITFDDGYLCNFEQAFPILMELNIPATINIIGSRRGQATYEGHPSTPHFTWEDAAQMVTSGLITLGSHTYAMHGRYPHAQGGWAIILEHTNFVQNFKADIAAMHAHTSTHIFAYPFGIRSTIAEEILINHGYTITLLTGGYVSHITRGDPATLHGLYRINVPATLTPADLTWLVYTLSK